MRPPSTSTVEVRHELLEGHGPEIGGAGETYWSDVNVLRCQFSATGLCRV